MKTVFIAFMAMAFASIAKSATITKELPADGYGTPVTVSVSSFTLTKLPTYSTLPNRSGIVLNVPNSNTGDIVGHFGNCSSAPAASTVRVLEIGPAQSDRFFPVGPNSCLWVITTNTTGAENVHIQEVRQ